MTREIGPEWLDERLRSGDVIVIDGATGTELQARGVPMQRIGWSSLTQLDYPDILEGLHREYIQAGASVITKNTFAAARHMLEPGGIGHRLKEINTRAVEIAQRARDASGQPVAIAGSISAYMADSFDPNWLEPGRLYATYEEQVEILVERGVDLIICEMMQRPDISVPAVKAAVSAGVPVWLGLTCKRSRNTGELETFDYPNHSFRETVEALADEPVSLVCLMHTAVNDIEAGLALLREYWDEPFGVYPESGFYTEPYWNFVDVIDPANLVTHASRWVNQHGVRVVGGCCGIGVEHIRKLKETFS